MHAEQRDIDLWKLQLSHPNARFDDEEERPDGMTTLPGGDQQPRGMAGNFVYYWSFGVDAEVAYR